MHLGTKHGYKRMLFLKHFRIIFKNRLYEPFVFKYPRTISYIMDVQQEKRRQKNELKRKSVKTVPGTVTLQVLGSGAYGSPAAVYLFTDQSRYLFNCGEGTQRLAHEHKTKLSRLEQVFVTRNTWSVMGGLPGLALTVQDAGVRELSVHGPPELDSILLSMQRFVILKKLQVTTLNCTENRNRFFEDQVMSVECIPIENGLNKFAADGAMDMHSTKSTNSVICYVCKLKPKPGSLNLERCVEKGVPPGPLLGLLKNGNDITLGNGNVVRSVDVSEPPEEELSFMFLDLPDEQFLNVFSSRLPSIHRAHRNVAYVIHFSPDDITKSISYEAIIQSFTPNTKHLFLNGSNTFSGYVSAHRIQYQLHQIHPKIFPRLAEAEGITISSSNDCKKMKMVDFDFENHECQAVSEFDDSGPKLTDIQSHTNIQLRPKKGLNRSLEAKLNVHEFIKETHLIDGFVETLEKLKVDLIEKELTNGDGYNLKIPKITFLGTGSCIPNKTRNVSAILIQTNEESYALFDCGEGTLGQMVRLFGSEAIFDILRNLKVIYVSHLHADHHIGIIEVLNQRRNCGINLQPLLLFAPKQIQPWLNFYNDSIEEIDRGYRLIPNGEMMETPFKIPEDYNSGIQMISTCLVRHCPHSFGVSITLEAPATHCNRNPIKITYSGDTMPCNDLIDLGRDSTILIHEATMEDDLIEEARNKMHSTISEAICQGRLMNAQYTILTHFSQRYAKLPRMNTENIDKVAIAFDNMQITIDDLKIFHLLYPALKSLFAEHYEELEQKAMKREFKLDRKRKLQS